MTTVLYKNRIGNEITNQQVQQISTYFKVYLENSILKKKEFHDEGKISYVEYYLDSSEIEAQVLTTLQSEYSANTEIIIFEVSYSGLYRIEIGNSFTNGVSNNAVETLVYNENNKKIYEKVEDGFNPIIPPADITIKKYYYENQDDDDYTFEFNYDEIDGSIESIGGWGEKAPKVGIFNDFNDFKISPDRFNTEFPDFFTNSPYYLNGDMLQNIV